MSNEDVNDWFDHDEHMDQLRSGDSFSEQATEAVWKGIFLIVLAALVVSTAIAAACSWWMPPIERR